MSNDDEKVTITVTSHNQSGGITAHTVNINAAPEPKILSQKLFVNQPHGSEFRSRIELTVDSPYPPGNLLVAVSAPTVRSINLTPQRPGLVMMGNCGNRQGMSFANLQQPFGRIHLDVVTGAPEHLNIECSFTP